MQHLISHHLRLFKEVFENPLHKGLKRLLFEGGDIYIYAWVSLNFELKTFQVIWRDTYLMNCNLPGKITVGKVGCNPFNRSVATPAQGHIIEQMVEAVCSCDSTLFPVLISAIARIAQGEHLAEVVLCDREVEIFKALPGG
jgi:hypothetical protein